MTVERLVAPAEQFPGAGRSTVRRYKQGQANMEQHEQLTTTEARQGATPHVTRYVLLISLILVVLAFAALMLIWK